jgi:hypothetical protein
MKSAVRIASVLLLGAASAWANALVPEMMKAPVQETLPPGAKVSALEVQPTKIALSGKYETAQLVITARLTSGDAVDVTRLAHLSVDGGVAEVNATGQIAPLHNGTGSLRAEIAGKSVSAPVLVADIVDKQTVDFIRDVNPVMTKLGCNAGTCHGAKEGKYGFKLSLRGYDPIYDVRSLKDDLAGRRLNSASPDDSLMLLKATAGVPHEGGLRTPIGSTYYQVLRSWIADGAKLDLKAPRVAHIDIFPMNPVVQQVGARQQVRVVATYTDGKTRDVTAEAFVESGNSDVAKTDGGGLIDTLRRGEAPLLARYEGNYMATTLTVMGDRTGFAWQQPETWSRIDELVASKWERMKIQPSDLCTDAEFLRRVYLDLTGLPPTAEEVRAFMEETSPPREKRDAIIDKLIGSPQFVEHWTNKWADMLEVNSKFLGGEGAAGFRAWIKDQVTKNVPYDQFVREILTATGSNKDNPAASYWKIQREPSEAMENTTHLFLATRFNCNKCHDHPFERWTQDQYYHLGAYFSQVALAGDPASGKRVIAGTAVEKARPLYEIVKDAPTGDMIHLRTNKVAAPSFPFETKIETPLGDKPTRREQLAAWVTSSDNRFFALSYVNRLWGYLTGVGVIEPLDDIRAGNPPTNPELLDYLKTEFINHGFDVRHVIRLICQSRTYQLSVATNKWNEDDKINYSHAVARRLPAEVLYDSVLKVTGAPTRLPGGTGAQQLPDSALDLPSGFLANLGRPARESACECERSNDLRLGSVMALLSGPAVADAIGDEKSGLAKLVSSQTDDSKLANEIFLRVLSRPATETELKKTLAAWGTINPEHDTLIAEWEAKEKEQAPVIAQMEADRLKEIDTAKTELARYQKEIQPKVDAAEKKRQADVAAAGAAVKAYEKDKLAAAQAKFEETVPIARTYTGWEMLEPADLRANNNITLTKQADGSIKAGPQASQNADYIVTVDTKMKNITGILLEVLPSADEPAFGPGRASGNFVLGEFGLKAADYGANPVNEVEFSNAIADISQQKFEVKLAIDGKKGDQNNGWAIGGATGVPHYAVFTIKKPLADEKGSRLRFELNMPRNGKFTIARFRLWATDSKEPLTIGLPLAVIDSLRKPAEIRTKEDKAALASYWKESDPDLRKLTLTLGKDQMPLPIDPGVLERQDVLTKAELPIKLDPKLVQLRQDSKSSNAQIANKRLTAAQDLTWALVNNPAFLFNH